MVKEDIERTPTGRARLTLIGLLAICAVLLASAATANAENVIKNGTFASGLADWSAVSVNEGSFSGYPHIDTYNGGACSPELPHVSIDVPGGADGYVEQTIKVPASGGKLTFLAWSALEAPAVTISVVSGGTPSPLLQFSPPAVQAGPEGEECSGAGAVSESAGLSAYAGQEVGLRVEATSGGYNGTIANLTNFELAPGEAVVKGSVQDQKARAADGAKLTIKGTSDEKQPVEKSTTANASGEYAFEVPSGNYAVSSSGEPSEQNGGVYSIRKSSTSPGQSECPGTAKESTCELKHIEAGESDVVNYTYTQCAATEREPHGKEPTGCPIIFVPGILGSRIFCNQGELFLSISGAGGYFGLMQLQSDGETNKGPAGSCGATAYVPKGEAGLLKSVGPVDAYGSIYEYLKSIATNGIYAFPYDWRRGVPVASKDLADLVGEALKETGAEHVVLVAHSMGGLVSEQYVVESSGAKVSRVLTIGTPYWGAPKSLISLMNGLSNEFSSEGLDVLLNQKELQLAVRNYTGLFWLYPSAEFGPWLQVSGAKGVPHGEVGGSQIDSWVSALKGNSALLDKAEAGHASLDGFKPGEVDYQIIAGTGVPTIVKMKLAVNEFEPEQWVSATYASGDGTVPARSQTQGAFPANESGPVKIHYVCGVKHADEPGSEKVQGKIKAFVLSGGEITGPEEDCRYTGGAEVVLYHTNILALGKASAVSTPAAGAMSVEQAIAKGLIQFLQLGGRTVIITNQQEPVTLKLSGSNVGVRVRAIEAKGGGAPVYYGPLSGAITLNGTTLSKGSKKLRPTKSGRTPRASAHVSRRGRRFLVRLRSAGPSSGIRYRIGRASPRAYAKPLLLTRAQFKQLRYAAESPFGVWERPQRAHLPR